MKKIKNSDAFDEKKFKKDYEIYSKIKQFEDKLNDNDTINLFVAKLEKNQSIKISEQNRLEWYDEYDGWCYTFRYFCLLKEVVIPHYGWDLKEYEDFKKVVNALKNLKEIV